MKPSTTLFYDEDTQRDFIHADGALAVPGAEKILPALAAITALGWRAGVRLAGSVDRHYPEDPELQRNGGPYPDHCMNGTPGQKKVDATAPRSPIWIENRIYRRGELDELLEGAREVIIEKQRLDVIDGNRNAEQVLGVLLRGVADVVIYGVCTEICVDLAIERLRNRGLRLHVPTDAIAALNPEEGVKALQRWREWGVNLTTVAQLERELVAHPYRATEPRP